MSRANIGVAIRVPEPFCSDLQAWRERLGDPNATAIVPHVTLLPPTLVRLEALGGIETHLAKVAWSARRFDIRLRGSASFRPLSPVVFVPLAEGISACEWLENRVRSGPLTRSTRFPYHPHVTVAHDLPDAALDRAYHELAEYDARFAVNELALFVQDRDGGWQPHRHFPFGPDDSAPLPDGAARRHGW